MIDCNGMSILDPQLKQHTIEKYKKKLLHLSASPLNKTVHYGEKRICYFKG